MKTLTIFSTLAFIIGLGGSALAGCDDPNRNCFEKLQDATQDLKQSNSLSDAWENTKAAGTAAKDCVNCGLENVESNVKQITPNNSR